MPEAAVAARARAGRCGRIARALPGALLLCAAGAAGAQETTTFDAGTFDAGTFDAGITHRFRGFGVNLFVPAARRAARDAVMRDLQVRFARVSVFQKLPDEPLRGHPDVAAIGRLIAAAEQPADVTRLEQFRDEMRALHVGITLVYRKLPEVWSERFGVWNGHDQRRVRPERIGDYANWVTAQLLNARRHGIEPQAVELMGEPDGSLNTLFTPAQYDTLVVQARAAMDAAGLRAVGIAGPGTSKVALAAPYLAALVRSGHLRLLAQLSLHDYDTLTQDEPAGLAALPRPLLAAISGLPIVMTEFGDISPRWRRAPYDADPYQQGGRNPATLSDAYAAATAAEALRLISDGAAAIYLWELEDHDWQELSFGLLDRTGRRRPMVAALQSFLPLIPPDAPAIAASGATPGLGAAGFLTKQGPLLALANLGAGRTLRVRLLHVSPTPRALHEIGSFPARPPAAEHALHDGEAVLTLPPDSVVVLRGE